MSEDNVEVVRGVMRAWERGERAPAALMHDDVEWVNPAEAVESGTRRGSAEFDAAQTNFAAAFDAVEFAVERLVDLGDRVLMLTRSTFRGRGSGVAGHRSLAFLWTVRDGKVTRFQWFNDHEEGLEAVGLREGP